MISVKKKGLLFFCISIGALTYLVFFKKNSKSDLQSSSNEMILSSSSFKATGVPKTINIDYIFEDDKKNREPAGLNKLLVNANRIQLTGKIFNKKLLSVINKSNQFTATLFISKNKFQTDFIDLQTGLNEITFEWSSGYSDQLSYQTLWLDVN